MSEAKRARQARYRARHAPRLRALARERMRRGYSARRRRVLLDRQALVATRLEDIRKEIEWLRAQI